MARLVSLLLAVLVLAPACAEDTTGAFGAIDDGSTGAATGGEADGADDGETAEKDDAPRSLLECEIDVPCEFPFLGANFDASLGAALTASDLCVFATLASGEPALIETVAEFSDATARLDYVIVGPGETLRQASGESDAGGRWLKGVYRCELQPREFFTACMKAPSSECLDPEAWVVGCDPLDNLVCPG
ncbi:hypothetical protein [Nannocystis radixulma]|uniref:Uncharacterized protein n=1 Tax=Nannocystis radixulma TaxID=2995305 RepID=A0ABT5B0J6_9BACT|nr:hypothetical protein [Nannocystis radixulma]MDC0667625.1 hypothetical protein [Nannocystis radixulma]